MFHLDNNSGISAMPKPAAQQSSATRWFTEGGGNNSPSWPGQDWFNIVQAELLNVLTAAGIAPEKTAFNQLALAIKAIINKDALLKDNLLSEIRTAGASSQKTARENLDITDATLNKKGLTQLSNAVDSTSEAQSATSKAVKIAMDNANARLAKDRNGADIPNVALFLQNVGLNLFIQSTSSTRVISPGKVLSLVITNDNWGVYREGLNVRVPLSIAAGGTGGGTPEQARDNLGIPELVKEAISALVDSAPATLDTLGELAAAIGNDPNYSTSVSNALSGKASGDLFYDTNERVGMRTRDKQFLVSVGTDGTMGFWSEAQKKFVFWVDASGQLTTGIIPAARVTGLAEIGVGQTWRDMSAQRAFNTVYTNSTGKPISVSVTGRNQNQQTYTELWVGAVKVSSNYKDSNSDSAVSAIIPAGAVYKVVATGGTLLNWAELS